MGYTTNPNESDPPHDASGPHSSAWLIRVAASEQQAPGALHCCPVCGLPFAPEQQTTTPWQIETLPGGRQVFLCGRCHTYSVGQLDAQDETGE